MPIHQLKISPREAAPPKGMAANRATLRILVVEDNRDGAETLAALLRAFNHDVRIAFDGLAALAIADEYQPDVVLLDIGLPGLNGYDVARLLRERRGEALIILAVSGYCQPADRERSKAAGVNQHLAKPVNVESLLKFLATVNR